MPASYRPRAHRNAVRREYGHPWPWMSRTLVVEHAVEPEADIRELADEWGCSEKVLARWIRRYGFRTEEKRVVR